MITGTYNLVVDPQWRNVQLQELFLECDTTLAPVTINLFPIADLNRFWNVKLIISDANKNASVNNITINTGSVGLVPVFDTIDEQGNTQIILNTNGESVVFQPVSESTWLAIESLGGGAGVSEYKQALLPSTSLVTASIPQPDLVGDAYDLGTVFFFANPFIRLENGSLAVVQYCQSVLLNGILIYEAYDLETLAMIDGYWIAFEQDAQNPKLLNKVAELQMTQEFWDNWYDWTVKDSGDNAVKFVTANTPNGSLNPIESYITTLTYANGTLSATDTSFTFGGATVLSLYESLSGSILTFDPSWNYQTPEYILDDDYYGMALGTQAGWYYYRDLSAQLGAGTEWNCVGFNVLTGETRWVTPTSDIVANVTNFNFTGVDSNKFINNWFNHPNGITFQFADAQPINNGNNVNGVTCIWSPFYNNPNEVIYINTRASDVGTFISTEGSMQTYINQSWYWDNENIYTYQWFNTQSAQCMLVERFNTNTKLKTIWNVPVFEQIFNSINSWANNNGLLLNSSIPIESSYPFGLYRYMYFTNNADYLTLQSNNSYPTNVFGDKTYSTYSGLIRNVYNVGVEIDEYTDVEF